jgi:hypothetical protein
MARFWGHHGFGHHGFGHHGFGHGGFGHGGFRRWHRPWHPHFNAPLGADADGDGDGDDGPPPPPSFPFPPVPPIFPGLGEMEAERYGHRRHRRQGYSGDDQEVSLNDEPAEPPREETKGFRRSGRWVLSGGKLILFGV